MSRRYQVLSSTKFKGLNTSDYKIDEEEFKVLQNVSHTPSGSLRKRPGIWNAHPSGALMTVGDYKCIGRHTSPTIDYIYWASAAKVYRSNVDGSNLTEILLAAASIPSVQCGVQGFSGNFYFFRPGAQSVQITAAGVVSVTPGLTTPTIMFGTQCLWYKNRFFTINSYSLTGDESYLYYSDPVQTVVPNATNRATIGLNDGQACIAMTVYNDQIWVFKDRSIWTAQVDGDPSTWTYRKVSDTYGCIGAETIEIIDGLLYFLSYEGVIRSDGQGFEVLSIPIESTFLSYLNQSGITAAGIAQMQYTAAFSVDNKYIVLPKSPYVLPNTTVWFVFDIINEAWSQWLFGAASGSLTFQVPIVIPGVNPYVLYAPVGGQFISKQNFGQFLAWDRMGLADTINIEIDIRTANRVFDKPTQFKRHMFTDMEMISEYQPTITYYKELYGTTPAPTVGQILGSTPRLAKAYAAGRFQEIQTRLQLSTDRIFELYSISYALLGEDNVGYGH